MPRLSPPPPTPPQRPTPRVNLPKTQDLSTIVTHPYFSCIMYSFVEHMYFSNPQPHPASATPARAGGLCKCCPQIYLPGKSAGPPAANLPSQRSSYKQCLNPDFPNPPRTQAPSPKMVKMGNPPSCAHRPPMLQIVSIPTHPTGNIRTQLHQIASAVASFPPLPTAPPNK